MASRQATISELFGGAKGSTSTSKPSLTKRANKHDSDRKYDKTRLQMLLQELSA